MKNWKNTLHLLGIATCLLGALLMDFGEPLIGLNHTGIATAVGITGLGIIVTANKTSFRKEKGGKVR